MELFKGDDFAGRCGVFPETIFLNTENNGPVFQKSRVWREQRRAFLRILYEYGMKKHLLEEQVLASAQEFLKHLSSLNNKEELCLKRPIQMYIANIINKALYGFSYEYGNCDRLMSLVDSFSTFVDTMK
ncbi:hypothetical protein COOONC_18710 [Cooperia oncophora]